MPLTALVIAAVALLLALAARAKAGGEAQRVADVEADGRRRLENLREELEGEVAKLRELVALLADGGRLDGEMVRDGRLWRDVEPTEAAGLVEAGGVRLVDVRSPQETSGGVIPGALLIPIDELETRRHEIPRDGRPTLVYCAGGGRSAAACEYLSSEGWAGLMNLQGGVSSWPGTTAPPPSS